jgi:hypothetical protein
MKSSHPSAGKSMSAEPNSRQPFLPIGIYNSVYSSVTHRERSR